MPPRWLTELIADAERVADASLRLKSMPQPAILSAITQARGAKNDVEYDAAYRALQTALPAGLATIDPVTLFDLKRSWAMNNGFVVKPLQLYGFWALSIILLVIVAYTTSLYSRATDIAETLAKYKDVRLTEQAVQVFNLAKQHETAIAKQEVGNGPTFASETFFRSLTDLQTTLTRINASIAASNEIGAELEVFNQLRAGACQVAHTVASILSFSVDCIDPRLAFPAEIRTAVAPAGELVPVAAIKAGPASPTPDLDKYLNEADLFFQNVGVGLIQTRVALPMFDFSARRIKDALDTLRSWIVPAAYGSLGAAIFFTRRILNPMLPNPEPLRVIYRIMFGGFAGIIFAWFWSPTMTAGVVGTSGSLSAFGIAFLAGYSTDVLFQILDRLVQVMGQQVQGKPPPAGS